MAELPPRLAAVAELVPAGCVVADIGTDHAALPLALVRSGRAPRAIATEVAPAPFEYARRTVAAAGFSDRIDLRFGSGLETLLPGEAGCIVMAGMGAWTIVGIIERDSAVARFAQTLVLQPQTDLGLVRRTLHRWGYRLLGERLAREGSRFYVAMAYHWEQPEAAVEPAEQAPPPPGDILWEVGPGLLVAKDPLLGPYLRHLIAVEEQHLAGQSEGTTDRSRSALARSTERLESLKQLLDEVEGGQDHDTHRL